MMTYILLILQSVMALLFTVQSTPNLPEAIKQQAIDYSYQAVEIATQSINELTTPTTDETGKVLAPAAITETIIPTSTTDEPKLEPYERTAPCILFPEKTCKYPYAPTSNPQWVNPPQEKYPQYLFKLDGNPINIKETIFVKKDTTYILSWNATQIDGNTLICEGNINNNGNTILLPAFDSISIIGSHNFNLSCKDKILGTGNNVGLQILAR